jgi:hypothetical protein
MLTENVISPTPQSGGSDPGFLPPNRGVQNGNSLAPNRGVLKESGLLCGVSGGKRTWTRPAATDAPTTPDRLAELVTRWGMLIDIWLNGEFKHADGRYERNLHDETMVTRSAIVRAVMGLGAVSTGWANDTVDAVMNVPAWKRVALAGDVIAYRLCNAYLRNGERLEPLP